MLILYRIAPKALVSSYVPGTLHRRQVNISWNKAEEVVTHLCKVTQFWKPTVKAAQTIAPSFLRLLMPGNFL